MSIITVIGSGQMGSALAFPLCDNGHTVRLVGSPLDGEIIKRVALDRYHPTLKRTLPQGVEAYDLSMLEAALEGTELIVGGVSSFGLDWFKDDIIPRLPEGVPVLSVTKGMVDLEDGSLVSYPEVYEGSTDKKISFNAIGGPCTSYELADRDYTCVRFCGRDIEELERIRDLFATDYYNVGVSVDVRGVECAVAMKNAYALAVSLAIGMSYKREGRELEHYNSQAALFYQSVTEMRRLLKLCGGGEDNIALGAGDLYVTVFGGRTRKIGTLLGTGMPLDEALERLNGVTLESLVSAKRTNAAVKRLIAAGKVAPEDFPLLLHVGEILDGQRVNIPWKSFKM